MIHTFSGMVNVSVVPELGGRGATGPPPSIFGRSVNPIPNGVGRLCPPLPLAPPPKVFHLPASVFLQKCNQVLQTATTQIDRLGELPDILLISAFLGFVRL